MVCKETCNLQFTWVFLWQGQGQGEAAFSGGRSIRSSFSFLSFLPFFFYYVLFSFSSFKRYAHVILVKHGLTEQGCGGGEKEGKGRQRVCNSCSINTCGEGDRYRCPLRITIITILFVCSLSNWPVVASMMKRRRWG